MSAPRAALRLAPVLLLLAPLSGCGGDDICLGCPDGTPTPGPSGVTVTGTIVSTSPLTSPSSINVLICVGLPAGGSPEDCDLSFLTTPSVEGTFTRNNVEEGSETIFFWVDENQNGTIEPDDPIAKLDDVEGQLENVRSGQTVTLSNVRILFLEGTASATITVSTTPTPTPTAPQATPTPTSAGF